MPVPISGKFPRGVGIAAGYDGSGVLLVYSVLGLIGLEFGRDIHTG